MRVWSRPIAPRRAEAPPASAAAKRAGLTAIAAANAGAVGIIAGTGPITWGHWEEEDVPVSIVALSNGAENAILVLSPGGATMAAGNYTLHTVLDRDRWASTTSTDPEQHYHDEVAIPLAW